MAVISMTGHKRDEKFAMATPALWTALRPLYPGYSDDGVHVQDLCSLYFDGLRLWSLTAQDELEEHTSV